MHDLAIGQPDGKAAQAGQKVTVEYVGSLQKTGKVFDQAKSFGFRLGEPSHPALISACQLLTHSSKHADARHDNVPWWYVAELGQRPTCLHGCMNMPERLC